MRIMLPSVEYQVKRYSLAARPPNLDGKVVAFTDAWGYPQADGRVDMYPLMSELKKLLEESFRLSGSLWYHKINAAQPLPPEFIRDIEEKADVVINGECWGGGETVSIVEDAVELEKRGKPTITIAHKSMEKLCRAFCAAGGMPDLPFLFEPLPDERNVTTDAEQLARANVEHVISSLTSK